MADPATSTFAPASIHCRAVSGFTPPSTSTSISLPVRVTKSLTSVIFGRTEVIKDCPPNPGFTDMSKINSTSSTMCIIEKPEFAELKTTPPFNPCSLLNELSDANEYKPLHEQK